VADKINSLKKSFTRLYTTLKKYTYRTYRKWLVRYGLYLICLLGVLGVFNYLVDPIWCFSHGYRFSNFQKPFNERQQKTNYLKFNNKIRYDALIIGNSRTSLINQNDFVGMRAYNYSMGGMTPIEYGDYIDYFKGAVGPPAVIFLSLDFSGSSAEARYYVERPSFYIGTANSPLYRYRILFTNDTFNYSRENLRLQHFIDNKKHGDGIIIYDHANVASILPPNDKAANQSNMLKALGVLAESYRNSYKYRGDYKEMLRQLLAENPGSRFVVFTTPVTEAYFCTLVKEGLLPAYERWIRECVEVFGQVWHFEYPHSIARNQENFCDTNHFYPHVGTLIAQRITGVNDPGIPEDFGMLLTPATIDEGLARIRTASGACRQEASSRAR
jgi:hypothetical protein